MVVRIFSFLLLFAVSCSFAAKESSEVERVLGSSPPMTYLIYALNPDKMIGLNFEPKNMNNSVKFIDARFLSLPIIGSFHGGSQKINIEALISIKPDLILMWEDDFLVKTVEAELKKTGIKTANLKFRKIVDMPKSIAKAGDLIGEKARGEELSKYAQKMIDEVSGALANTKPVRYYYAEGMDALSTECSDSFHVEALNFVNGKNVHECSQSHVLGLEKISFEQLLKYDPDVIVAQNQMVYKEIMTSSMWKHLRAVKNQNVHTVPNDPFHWIDRPPSFMRVLGVQYLASIFHPQSYKVDLQARTAEFYKLFLHVDLTPDQVNEVLGGTK